MGRISLVGSKIILPFLIIALLAVLFFPAQLKAQTIGEPYELDVIANEYMTAPGSNTLFDFFSDVVAIGEGNVAFNATYDTNREGIFLYDEEGDTLSVIVNSLTRVPEGSGFFQNISRAYEMFDGTIAFLAEDSFSDEWGIYVYINGSYKVLVNEDTPVPGSKSNFRLFNESNIKVIEEGVLAFEASPEGPGIYTVSNNGNISLVVNTDTPVPGRPDRQFRRFSDIVPLGDGDLAFQAQLFNSPGGAFYGYAYINGEIIAVGDDLTVLPDSKNTILAVGNLTYLGSGNVSFSALDGTGGGIAGHYKFNKHLINTFTGPLSVIVDKNTEIPNGEFTPGPNFDAIGGGGISEGNGNLAFIGGNPSASLGNYLNVGGKTIYRMANTDSLAPPNGLHKFIHFSDGIFGMFVVDKFTVGFKARTSRHVGLLGGLYVYLLLDDTISLVADDNILVPGGTRTFRSYGFPTGLRNGNVAFDGTELGTPDEKKGIYIGRVPLSQKFGLE